MRHPGEVVPLPLRSLEDDTRTLVPWQPTVESLCVAAPSEILCNKLIRLVQSHGNSVPEVHGSGLTGDDVFALLAYGVVTRIDTIFDDTELVVNWCRLTWRAMRVAGNPCLAIIFQKPFVKHKELSKVECAVALMRAGWKGGALTPYKDGEEQQFRVANLFKSKAYWLALLAARKIFKKSVHEICHVKPNHYYECLLQLPAERLTVLLSLPNMGKLKDVDFLRFLKGHDITDTGLGSLEDLPEGGPGDGDAILPVPPPPPATMMRAVAIRGEEEFKGVKIKLDYWSHQSGERRAYISCPRHRRGSGQPCVKYVFLKSFPCERHCMAWLWVWRSHASDWANQAEHLLFEPQDEEVDRVLAEES